MAVSRTPQLQHIRFPPMSHKAAGHMRHLGSVTAALRRGTTLYVLVT